MTLAQCLINATSVTLAFATTNIDEPYYTMNVDKNDYIIHPDYSSNSDVNNIAVIQLSSELKFNSKIGKIKMESSVVRPMIDILALSYAESNDLDRTFYDTHLYMADSKIVNFKSCKGNAGKNKHTNEQGRICIDLGAGWNSTYGTFSGGSLLFSVTKL